MSLQFVDYDEQERALTIRFDGGEVYTYHLVPPDEARHAEVALAAGDPTYFKSRIRGVYPAVRAR